MSSAYAVAGAANDAMNSEEAEAVVAAACSAGNAAVDGAEAAGAAAVSSAYAVAGAASDAMNSEEAEAIG